MDPAHVLVIEDDPDIREALIEVLRHHGYPSVGAEHGQEALDKLEKDALRPCVILLDLMMPVMDGRTFREEQLRRPTLADIPVVVISAAYLMQDSDELKPAAQLKKPIKMPDLLKIVREHCAPLPTQ